MAKGRATPGTFKKGDPRAIAAGKKSSRALPPEIKEARELNRNLVESTITKYYHLSVNELEALLSDKTISVGEMILIRIMALAMQNGDVNRLNFIYDRTIGKVAEKLDVRASIIQKTLHDQIVEEIEKHEVIDVKALP